MLHQGGTQSSVSLRKKVTWGHECRISLHVALAVSLPGFRCDQLSCFPCKADTIH